MNDTICPQIDLEYGGSHITSIDGVAFKVPKCAFLMHFPPLWRMCASDSDAIANASCKLLHYVRMLFSVKYEILVEKFAMFDVFLNNSKQFSSVAKCEASLLPTERSPIEIKSKFLQI